jgi:hypothetical protein
LKMKMGPFCKSPGRVLLHIIMVGLLSQVMDKANMNVVNGNVVNENMNVKNQNMNVVNVVYVVNVVKDNVGRLSFSPRECGYYPQEILKCHRKFSSTSHFER